MPDEQTLRDKLFDIFIEWAKDQSFTKRAYIAHQLGLYIACCPGCGCYLDAPYCAHQAEDDCNGCKY